MQLQSSNHKEEIRQLSFVHKDHLKDLKKDYLLQVKELMNQCGSKLHEARSVSQGLKAQLDVMKYNLKTLEDEKVALVEEKTALQGSLASLSDGYLALSRDVSTMADALTQINHFTGAFQSPSSSASSSMQRQCTLSPILFPTPSLASTTNPPSSLPVTSIPTSISGPSIAAPPLIRVSTAVVPENISTPSLTTVFNETNSAVSSIISTASTATVASNAPVSVATPEPPLVPHCRCVPQDFSAQGIVHQAYNTPLNGFH